MSDRSSKVAVCIPVFNGASFIAESIASVLGQTYGDLSLVVCDNCSNDGTEAIVRRFSDPRLRYVRNPRNLGIVGNFNRCVQEARADYLCLWHHDDVMLPENLEQKVRVLDDHPSVGLVHSNMIEIDASGAPLGAHWAADSRRDYVENGLSYFRRTVLNPNGVCCPTVVTRKACYDRLGAYDSRLTHACDFEMWLRIALYFDVACLGAPLIKYRRHAMADSNAFNGPRSLLEEFRAKRILLTEHCERIPASRALKQLSYGDMARRAVGGAQKAFWQDDFAEGRAWVKAAATIYPPVLADRAFWRIAIRLGAGQSGVRLYRACAQQLGLKSRERP